MKWLCYSTTTLGYMNKFKPQNLGVHCTVGLAKYFWVKSYKPSLEIWAKT